jgi:outer membrane protein assembly factor BamB
MVSGVQKMMAVGTILSSPAIANGTIYVGSTDGNIYALN